MGTDYVAIADNADPQIHVLVYRRAKQLPLGQSRLVCAAPVFKPGQSCTENSFIATDNAVVVENNFGARTLKATMHGKTTEPGITRLDIASNAGWLRWNNTEETVTCAATEKLSVKNGLIYAYTKSQGPPNTDAWYFTAIDFHTGETVYKVLAGTGLLYADPVSSMFIGPSGRLYIGVLGGIVIVAGAGFLVGGRRAQLTRRVRLVLAAWVGGLAGYLAYGWGWLPFLSRTGWPTWAAGGLSALAGALLLLLILLLVSWAGTARPPRS